MGRVGCFKGDKQISGSNIDGMETLPPNLPEAVVLFCIFCVRCRPRDRPTAEKSDVAVGLHTQIFQEHPLALPWHHKFPRAAQTSPRAGSWGQGGEVALERSTVGGELWRCGNLKEGDSEM